MSGLGIMSDNSRRYRYLFMQKDVASFRCSFYTFASILSGYYIMTSPEELSYDDLDLDVPLMLFEDYAPPRDQTTTPPAQKRQHPESSEPKREKPPREHNFWKMGRSRCGYTIHRCENCHKKPCRIFTKHGRIFVLQEICENCADGNIHMADVYYRYFGRKKKYIKH